MRRMGMLLVAVAFVCLTAGCVTISGGAAPSTRPLAAGEYETLSWTEGDSWGVIFLNWIPLHLPYTQAAIDEAIEKKGADALINVTVDNQHFYTFVLNFYRVRVEGLAVNMKPTARVDVKPSAGAEVEVRPRGNVEVRTR